MMQLFPPTVKLKVVISSISEKSPVTWITAPPYSEPERGYELISELIVDNPRTFELDTP